MHKSYYATISIAPKCSDKIFYTNTTHRYKDYSELRLNLLNEINSDLEGNPYVQVLANAELIVRVAFKCVIHEDPEIVSNKEYNGTFENNALVLFWNEPKSKYSYPEPLHRGFVENNEFGKSIISLNGRYIKGDWEEGDLLNNYDANKSEKYIGQLVLSSKYTSDDFKTIEIIGHEIYEVIPETVSEFTGVYDRNNKKIFEYCECTIHQRLGTEAKGGIRKIQGCCCFVEYGTRTIIKLCDLNLNSLEIEVLNEFCNLKQIEM